LQAGAAAAAVRGHLSTVQICSLARHSNALTRVFASVSTEADAESFAVTPGSLLHICCTDPQTHVHISNRSGQEDTVTLQVWRTATGSTKILHVLYHAAAGVRVLIAEDLASHACAGVTRRAQAAAQQHQGALLDTAAAR
jgi:hypothetical protein